MDMSSVGNRLVHTDSFRHTVVYAGLFTLAMAVLIGAVYLILDHSLKANLLREVHDDLTAIRTAYTTAPRGAEEQEAKEIIDDRLLAPDADDAFLLQRGNRRIAGNLPVMTGRTGTFSICVPDTSRDKTASRQHVIMGEGALVAAGVYAFVGRDLQQVRDAETGVLCAFGVVLLASLLLATLSGALLSRMFLRRIDAVAETCRSIMAGYFDRRIPATAHDDEFSRLGSVINDMLDRIQSLMETLRQVSTDIAHDMRTPLTHLRHKLERIREAAATHEEYQGAVDEVVTECDKLLAIFNALLRIAQIEAGARRVAFGDIDLRRIVDKARNIYAPVMDDAGRSFLVEPGAVAKLRGDEQLLLQLVSNLLDNALAHTPDRSAVALCCREENGSPLIVVADRGPGIPPEDREKVFRRFYRCEQSRSKPGSGLGLSLASAIADLHDADLILEDNHPGLRAVFRFSAKDNTPV